MKIYIFQRLQTVSNNWHPEGGLVVIARDQEHAEKIIYAGDNAVNITQQEWAQVEVYELAGDPEPKYWIMEDAGCC